ncbi:cell division protein FtsL [Nitrosomonas mobilis]|nr:cell division protein FtsL [Nitrosomonas mobilis]
MIRLNMTLFLILVISGLGIVTARHEARKLFMAQEKEQALAKQFATERDQLLLEQSTLAMHARVENIARTQLKMVMPAATNVLVIQPGKIRAR